LPWRAPVMQEVQSVGDEEQVAQGAVQGVSTPPASIEYEVIRPIWIPPGLMHCWDPVGQGSQVRFGPLKVPSGQFEGTLQ
jgi:hypothetical protein